MLDGSNDQIDKWAQDKTHDQFRTIMWAMMEKYQCRLGKKAPIPEETAKMLDYMDRWHQYELEWANDDQQYVIDCAAGNLKND